MKRMLLLAFLAAAAVPASADTWSAAYNGTIVSTYADGRVVRVYVNPDHSYSIVLPNGNMMRGVWNDANGMSCFNITNPPQPPGARPTCFPVKQYQIGDTFSGQDSTGSFIGKIVPGR